MERAEKRLKMCQNLLAFFSSESKYKREKEGSGCKWWKLLLRKKVDVTGENYSYVTAE